MCRHHDLCCGPVISRHYRSLFRSVEINLTICYKYFIIDHIYQRNTVQLCKPWFSIFVFKCELNGNPKTTVKMKAISLFILYFQFRRVFKKKINCTNLIWIFISEIKYKLFKFIYFLLNIA